MNEKSEEIHMNQFGIGITIDGTMTQLFKRAGLRMLTYKAEELVGLPSVPV